MQRGKLIVLEGIDGSTKGTQADHLDTRLINEGIAFKKIRFPTYGEPSAIFVEKYLRGEYGTPEEVGPVKASIFYAINRFHIKKKLNSWLEEGNLVICDRYATANMGHQACKISDIKKRDDFLDWLDFLEFQLFKIPRPDLVIHTYMPWNMDGQPWRWI